VLFILVRNNPTHSYR